MLELSKSMYDGFYGLNHADADYHRYGRGRVGPPEKKETKFDPYIYKIKQWHTAGIYLVIEINYPTAKHYEGNKVLVYEGVEIEDLSKQRAIDPHFSESKEFPSPIARFEPTNQGWVNALKFVSMLHSERLELSY
jgi:hypothetical protein